MTRPPVLLAASLAVCATQASAQLSVGWARTFDGATHQGDRLAGIALAPDGTAFVAGESLNPPSTTVPPTQTSDGQLVAYDASGNVLWSRRFASPLGGSAGFVDAALDGSGGVVAAGWASTPSGAYDVLVARYDAAGTLAWSLVHDGPASGDDLATRVRVDASGNAYACGTSEATTSGADALVLKVTGGGTVAWATRVAGSQGRDDVALDVHIDASGDSWIAGRANDDGVVSSTLVARVSANGVLAWSRDHVGSAAGRAGANALALGPQGRVYVAGQEWIAGTQADAALLAYDAAGTLLWQHHAHGDVAIAADTALAVAVDFAGDVVVAGRVVMSQAPLPPMSEAYLAKFGADGSQRWSTTWDAGNHGTHAATGVLLASGGEVYAFGNAEGVTGDADDDAFVVRYTRDGTLRSQVVFDAPGGATLDSATAGVLGATQSVWVGGSTNHAVASAYDFLTLRIDPAVHSACSGDGSGAPCPCGNVGVAGSGAGCLNSTGAAAELDFGGEASLAQDDLVLRASRLTGNATLFFQGASLAGGGNGAVFGDGLVCAGGALVRLGERPVVSTTAQFPSPGDAPVSVQGGVTLPGRRVYQAWYRDAAPYCTAGAFNLTNALVVAWGA